MRTEGLTARVEKMEAKRQLKRLRYVFVESEEDMKEKQSKEEPGFEYVYFHWVWDGDEVEI